MDEVKNNSRILQVNLTDSGGAFSLMFQVQQNIYPKVKFDYFSMGEFDNSKIISDIHALEGNITNAGLRKNRLLGHILLPLVFTHYLRKNKDIYNAIHIHSDTAWKLLLYAMPAKLVDIKSVIVHAHANGINGDYKIIKGLFHLMAKYVLPFFATTFLSCSEEASKWVYPQVIEDRIKIINNGINTEKFRFSYEKRILLRKKHNIDEDCLLVCMITDYSLVKNTEFAYSIARELLKKRKCMLLLIGDGERKKHCKEVADSYMLQHSVIFVGKVDNVEDYLSASDRFIMPSLSEGFPMSALEAEANGLKCIFSKRITEKIDVLHRAKFIDVSNESVLQWADELCRECTYDRYNAYLEVKKNGYDVENVSNTFLDMYEA